MSRRNVVAAMAAGLILAGCASQAGQYSADTFNTGLQQQQVEIGTVIAVQPVTGRGGSTLGSIAGGIGGALVGSQFGAGQGKGLAAGVGALAGAVGGGYAEQQLTSQQALEVTVRLAGGQVVGVVETGYSFVPGQKVEVIHDQGAGWQSARTTRVLPLSISSTKSAQ